MKRSVINFCSAVSVTFLLAVAGCAHATMRGTVAMKDTDQEAHVCLGDNEVKEGDRVKLYKSVCMSPKAAARSKYEVIGGCEKIPLGGGTVERTLNEHYSVVKVDPGVAFQEGTIVEKD